MDEGLGSIIPTWIHSDKELMILIRFCVFVDTNRNSVEITWVHNTYVTLHDKTRHKSHFSKFEIAAVSGEEQVYLSNGEKIILLRYLVTEL